MKRVAFAAFLVLCVFALMELGLRSADYRAPAKALDFRLRIADEPHGEPDRYRFWKIPGRGPHFTKGAYKIVCLADSVTLTDQGKGYPEDLPDAFHRAGYIGAVEVFNAGVPEYTSFQGRVYLERELLAAHPDLVTVHFGVHDHYRAPGGVPDESVCTPSETSLRFNRVFMRARAYQAVRALAMKMAARKGEAPFRVSPESYVKNLERIAELSRAAGALVALVAPPYLDNGDAAIALHRRYVLLTNDAGERLGVPVVDLTENFRFASDLFINPDSDPIHFNRDAGRMIAQAIAERVLKRH